MYNLLGFRHGYRNQEIEAYILATSGVSFVRQDDRRTRRFFFL